MDIKKMNLLQKVDSFLGLLATLICESNPVMVKAKYRFHARNV